MDGAQCDLTDSDNDPGWKKHDKSEDDKPPNVIGSPIGEPIGFIPSIAGGAA